MGSGGSYALPPLPHKKKMNKEISAETISKIVLISLGLLFFFSGVGKLIVTPRLENIFFTAFIGSSLTETLRHVLPYCEIIIGILLIFRIKLKYTSWFALAFILVFISNNAWLIAQGKGLETCGECLGWGIDIWPIGSLYIDFLMLMALLGGVKTHKMVVNNGDNLRAS